MNNLSENSILFKILPALMLAFLASIINQSFASETGIIIRGSINNFSSLADTGSSVPMEIGICGGPRELGVRVARHDTVSYDIALIMKTPFWLYPSMGFHYTNQLVDDFRGENSKTSGISYSTECWTSIKSSSMTTFIWSDLGVETQFPRKAKEGKTSWRSLIIGAGGSLVHAKDKIHSGKYTHYVNRTEWNQMLDEPPIVLENREEKDFSGFASSGFGFGWYILLGLQFNFQHSFSFAIKSQTSLGTVKLKAKNSDFKKDLEFHNGTVGIAISYKL